MKSRKEIRKSCKNWSFNIWENYLKTLEVEQQETLLDDPFLIEELSEKKCDTYQRGIPSVEEFSVLKKYLFEAFRELTDKQQVVLNRTVLEGLGLQEVSESMDISICAVVRIRDRALKSLGSTLINHMIEATHKTQKRTRTTYL